MREKLPQKAARRPMTRRQSQPHYSADSDLNVEMITWATTEFTQISWKRHFDMKLWVGTFYPRISSTPLSDIAVYRSDGRNVSSFEANRTEFDLFPIHSDL
jgi:hypothetical protein